MPEVERRGKRFRDRARWAIQIGSDTPVDNGGIARWELALLFVMLDLGGAEGKKINNWSHRKLAERLGVTPRSVKRWADGLRARGWLDWHHNMEKLPNGQVRQLRNSYVIRIPEWVAGEINLRAGKKPPPSENDGSGDKNGRGGRRRPSSPRGATPPRSSAPAAASAPAVDGFAERATGLPAPAVVPEVDEAEVGGGAPPVRRKAGSYAKAIKEIHGLVSKSPRSPP
ncbi:MAG: hypothetical protein AAF531_23840 [Actinomycetota bacterium]